MMTMNTFPHSRTMSGRENMQLCLKWADYTSNLTNVFDTLLQQESFVDVTISTEAGKSLKCHKVVLSACSAYFQDLFVENPCQHPIVILRDVEWRELNHIIEYMYKGQIHVGHNDLAPLLRSAESLQIRGLVDLIRSLEEELAGAPAIKRRRDSSKHPPPSSRSPSVSPSSQQQQQIRSSPPPGAPPDFPGRAEEMSDVKPGILEMIQEEQRAKMVEASQLTHNWIAAAAAAASAANPPQDNNLLSYQYQLQSMWQKCWNNNTAAAAANMLQVAGVRYRERGPMKSWRPETMAEAIWSVLQGGLSLSQAARTHDIPYPTFVLYANRVHNMLGPSRNGGSPTLGELRPKGRGRPQRILLGNWPESHVRQVIRAVVFREGGLSNPTSEDSLLLPKPASEDSVPERDLSPPPPRKASPPPPVPTPGSSSSELLSNQLKALYGGGGGSSSMSLMAAMGGPLSELIMKEIDFDPAMLRTLMTLQGNGVFEDAEERPEMSTSSTSSSAAAVQPPPPPPEVLLSEASTASSKEPYDNHRPQSLVAGDS